MTIDIKTGTTRRGRRKAFGLAVTLAALSCGVSAGAQTLFPTNSSPLPALPDAQLGTPGTSTVIRGTQTEPGISQTGAQQSGPPVFGATDPYAPTADQQPEGQENVPAAAALRERPYEDDLNQPYAEDLDPGAEPIDQQEAPRQPVDPTGIRMGSFMLRPSVSQSINTESTRTNGARDTRTYLATGIRGTLTSDWSRHALTVTGEGIYERNLRGNQDDTDPEANLNADLRLDLADDTEAHLTAGYNFEREDVSDPNSLGGNAEQAGIHEFTGGASIEREVGRIHGLAAIGATRSIYTDGKLSDGTVVSMKDRNRTGIDGRLRLGYELSPALIPFAEIAYGHTFYDRKRDSAGFARSSDTYAGRLGVEFDLGEKMRGEIAGGYQRVAYEDSRLDAVDAFTLDGNVRWSPQRGTDVDLGLRTAVQDATAPGESGWVEYQLNAAVAREVRDNLVARLTGATTFRDFQDSNDNDVTWIVGTGLTWSINRYLDMTADLEYERTAGGATDEDIFRAGVGLTLKR